MISYIHDSQCVLLWLGILFAHYFCEFLIKSAIYLNVSELFESRTVQLPKSSAAFVARPQSEEQQQHRTPHHQSTYSPQLRGSESSPGRHQPHRESEREKREKLETKFLFSAECSRYQNGSMCVADKNMNNALGCKKESQKGCQKISKPYKQSSESSCI